MNQAIFVPLCALFFLLLEGALRAEPRVFVGTNGQTLRGELVSVVGDNVSIKREDGPTVTFKAADFCPRDREYFHEFSSKAGSVAPLSGPDARGLTNTLGMKFVPVPGTSVLFCIHVTRNRDYKKYAEARGQVDDSWKNANYKDLKVSEGEDDPAVMVSWEDAKAFCGWLSAAEHRTYRLPTDHEWSMAVGIGANEDASASPQSKSGRVREVYPWGSQWPPPPGTENFADLSLQEKIPSYKGIIPGYRDGYATTAPVMAFPPNKLGLYDMGGNVAQWCEDRFGPTDERRVLRGGSWKNELPRQLLSSTRNAEKAGGRFIYDGFRVVAVP